jgi:predicted Zn-dependent protease
MIAFYETLQKAEQDHVGPPDFLSTHPNMDQRLATLTARAGTPLTDARQLLPGEDWEDIRTLCRLQAAKRSSQDSIDLP